MKFIQFHPFKTIMYGLWLMCLLQSCAISISKPEQNPIGTLRVIGDQVQINKRAAIDGQIIKSNDEITTGANSSAFIKCYQCGLIKLDINTD